MKIVYLGSGRFGLCSLEALMASEHELALVVTQQPHPAGRGRRPRPSPVALWAGDRSVPLVETDNANSPQVRGRIAALVPDVMVVIAFGQKLGAELLALPAKGAINVHASLLPSYRGAAPINWAIINGETQTGISIITLADKMDAGLVLAQARTGIGPGETAGQLHDRLAGLAAPLLLDTLAGIAAGTAEYTPQDDSKATFAPKLTKADGFLDFGEPAEVLARKVRGLWPWPGASADYLSRRTGRTTRVTIAMAEPTGNGGRGSAAPGTLDENLEVVCGQGRLRITRIKPAGSDLMSFKAFVNGRRTMPGDMFVKIGG